MAEVLTEIPVTADRDQTFAVQLAGQRLFFRLWWNATIGRWSFDLDINDIIALRGRRIVENVNLIGTFNFGIGGLYAVPVVAGAVADFGGLSGGAVKFLHYGPEN